MCEMCDGASHDEVLSNLHANVLRHDWALQGVEASPPGHPWVYTVGLSSGLTHPDLVWVGDVLDGARVLNELGGRVRAGLRIRSGDRLTVWGHEVEIGSVHPAHVRRGIVAMRDAYYELIGHEAAAPGLLQVAWTGGPSACGASRSTSLADDRCVVTTPNRAARRSGRAGSRRRR